MAALLFSSFSMLAALAGFALAVAWVRSSPPIGVALVCLTIVVLWERPTLFSTPIVTLAGASLYIDDLLTLLLFAAGLLQLKQLQANLRGWFFAWILFGVLIAMALIRAVGADGLASGVNAMRWLLHFFWAMTWVLGVRTDRLRLHTVGLVLGWTLVLVAVYHGVTNGFGGPTSTTQLGDGAIRTGRVLNATQSLALLLCAATVFLGPPCSAKARPQFYLFSSLVFGGVVVIAQSRSVWAAGALGVVGVLVWSARRRVRQRILVQLVLGASFVLVAWYSGMLVRSEISEAALDGHTYEWRTSGWQSVISEAIARGPVSVILGEPSASIFVRQIAPGQQTSVSTHNWYLDLALYVGLLGLVLLAMMLISALAKSRQISAVWTFVLAAVMGYAWAYTIDWRLAPWLGAAMAMSLGACRNAGDPAPNSGLATQQTLPASLPTHWVKGQLGPPRPYTSGKGGELKQ